MGWKGTVRSINSSFKAIDREAQRRQRASAKNAKALAKLQELEMARLEVEEYEETINRLKSLHALGEILAIDWNKIARACTKSLY